LDRINPLLHRAAVARKEMVLVEVGFTEPKLSAECLLGKIDLLRCLLLMFVIASV